MSLIYFRRQINEHNFLSHHSAVRNQLKRKLSHDDEGPPYKAAKEDTQMSSPSNNRCPNCKNEFQQILRHIKQSKCNTYLDPEFIQNVQRMSNEKRKVKQQMRSAKNRDRKRTEDPIELKRQQNKSKAASRERKSMEDHDGMKRQQNRAKATLRERKRMEDHEGMKRQQNKAKAKWRR